MRRLFPKNANTNANARRKKIIKNAGMASLKGYCKKCAQNGKVSVMVVKSGKFGMFEGCDNYPECKNTKTIR